MNYPTRFVYGEKLAHEETRYLEFKEVKGSNPCSAIINKADDYAVAFLNTEGGRILWGIRDNDKQVVGVSLSNEERDRLRRDVMGKLRTIQPQIDPSQFILNLHVIDGAPPELCIVELVVPAGALTEPFYTSGNDCFVRLDGTSQRLSGPQLTAWIRRRHLSPSHPATDPATLALAQRVRRVLTGHGLQPAHLARFFKLRSAPFTITLTDQQNDATFLQWLDEAKIDWIARTFGVRREWIDGEDDTIFEIQIYDKDPERFFSTISSHADRLTDEQIPDRVDAWFIRHGRDKDWGRRGGFRVFVIIRVPLTQVSSETIVYRYLSDFLSYPWNEGRTAVQLRAWARLLAVNKAIYCRGREVSLETGNQIADNGAFLHEMLSDHQLVHRCRDDWHPEDCALYPEESTVAAPDAFFPTVIDFLKTHRLSYEKTRLFGSRRAPSPK